MVSFLLPPSQTLDFAQCQNRPAMVSNEKESLRISFHRTTSKSPERVRRRTDPEDKPSRHKSANRNSWFKTITSSFMNGSGSPRTPSPQPDTPTHVRQSSRSWVDPKFFASRAVKVDPRLPDHMRRPELQLRRIQRREPPSSRSFSSRSGSPDRVQKHPHWWSA